MRKTLILSTEESGYFARLLQKQIPKSRFVPTVRKTFAGGERYFRIDINKHMGLANKDVVLTAAVRNDDEIAEVCRVGTAAAMYGAWRVTYAITFEGYTTMDRAKNLHEIVTAKTVAREFSQLPAGDVRNHFLFLDLHTEGLIHYFEGNCLRENLSADEVIEKAIKKLKISKLSHFASVDLGRPSRLEHRAKRFKTSLAFISKSREFEKTQVENVIGDVRGGRLVLSDDMIRSAGTLLKGADAYIKRGAKKIYADATHLALDNEGVIDLLLASPINKFVTTNSHPMSQHPKVKSSKRFVVVDVSMLFAEAIIKVT